MDAGRTRRCRRSAARLARHVPLPPFARRRLIQGSAPEGHRAVGLARRLAGAGVHGILVEFRDCRNRLQRSSDRRQYAKQGK